MFSWIRTRVKEAILAGCSDALVELGESDTGAALTSLRARLVPALPSPAPEPETAPSSNGRRKKEATT